MLDSHLYEINERDWAHESVEGTVRLAMVGTGWWTLEEAIPAVAETSHCTTTVVVDQDEAARQQAAEKTNARELTPMEFKDGVATDEYDAVYVATPNGTHLDIARIAADCNKDVLCEKPMEASVERSRYLVDVCEKAGVTLMVAYRMQTEPLVRRTKELLADSIIGEPIYLQSDMSATLLDINPDPNQWRLDSDIAGGCTLVDIGIYPINTIRFLLEEDPVSVSGTTKSSHPAFEEVDEHVWFELQFPGDVGAVCTASLNAFGTSNLRIVGQEGVIELFSLYHPSAEHGLKVQTEDASSEFTMDNVNQMTEEFEYFAHCLLTGSDPYPNGHHALRDMEILKAIYEADRTNQTVNIPEF